MISRHEPTNYPSLIERFAMKHTLSTLAALKHGSLNVYLPDGTRYILENTHLSETIDLHVHRYALFKKILFHGSVGFGEAYIDGDYECEDLTGLIALLANNREASKRTPNPFSFASQTLNRLAHQHRQHNSQIFPRGYLPSLTALSEAIKTKSRYYLNHCEAFFATRQLNDLQLILCCPKEAS